MKRLLVVDDLPEICELLSEILGWEGYSVTSATSAGAARKLIAESGFDLVLLDVVMPGEGGRSLAEHAASTGTKVILVSGSTQVLEAMDSFPWPVVAKPFRIDRLIATVRSVLAPV
jgi:two-component system, OmpR family, response regulator